MIVSLSQRSHFKKASSLEMHSVCFYLLTNDPEDLMHCETIPPEFCTLSSSSVLSAFV